MARILIVDDNSMALRLLETVLTEKGFEVTSAENGADALKMARKNPPDLIITDILMPVMDGFRLCREWKADAQLKTIPLIFYTATYTDSENEKFALSLGAERFVLKPQKSKDLVQIVREVLGEKRSPAAASEKPLGEEMEVLRQYNQVLFQKLEKKVLDLEREIVERIDTEEALRDSEEQYRRIIDTAQEGIWTLNAEGRTRYVNRCMGDMLGVALSEVRGRSFFDFVDEGDREQAEKFFARCKQGIKEQHDFCFRRKDGTMLWTIVSACPILDDEGRFNGVIQMIMDISERKRAEDELQNLHQALAHVSRVSTMGELTAALAHELNQPLTAIMANAQAALRVLANGKLDTDEFRMILSDIVEDDGRAEAIIQRIREQLKKGKIEVQLLEMNALIGEIHHLVRGDAARIGATIGMRLAEGLPRVRGDRIQVQQVVLNLMVNALDAVKEAEPGSRAIEVRSMLEGDRFVRVEVNDSGPGIPEEKREAIFDLFYTTKANGLGMGLPICRTIVQSLGGEIRAEQPQQHGARLAFTLPADFAEQP